LLVPIWHQKEDTWLEVYPLFGGNLKSNVSNYLELAQLVYIDACAKCIADVSDLRDLDTIKSRVEDEGISFLTITLPSFARDFENCLELGFVSPELFRGFRKNQAIPAFLQGMLSLIFNLETGRMYDKNSDYCSDRPSVIDSIRQICLAFKKLELACTPKRVHAALSDFVNTEQSFLSFSLQDPDRDLFHRVSRVLWDDLMANIRLDDCIPRHGPGATADRISGNQKYVWRVWHERLEPYFPLIDNAYAYSAVDSKELEMVTFVKPELEQPVRVTPVPKTLKSPRIIAIEPCCMQYAQQAIRGVLYDKLESFWLTAGHVNFRDQSVNQKQALISSSDKSLATIDLSEASDRVPHELALSMFNGNPDLKDAIDACRSTHAQMPDGAVIGPLRKFASMGSALCFPIESMYFYTICVAAQLVKAKLPVTRRNIFNVSRDTYVYGDDIIVPSTKAIVVLDYLQKYNCKINTSKTFYNGNFRESCGVEAFEGELVTPIYLRKCFPENKHQPDRLISLVETANLFYKKGYWKTADYIFRKCEKLLGKLPYLPDNSPGLGRTSFHGYRTFQRWNVRLQRFEIKCWVPESVYRKDILGGYGALNKSLSKLTGLKDLYASRDALHLERSALHGAVALKRRWVTAQ
jgi:hypothetical protein